MRETNKMYTDLGKPFDAADVGWRLQYVDKNTMKGIAVPFIDARAIADRLDEVVGPNRWRNSFTPWHDCTVEQKQHASQLCTISIYDSEISQWIDKTDGAEDSDIEPVKGGLSDAFKRAAVKWNIGRYLYRFEPVWVAVEQRGKSYVITQSEITRLTQIYNQTVARLFGGNTAPQQLTPPQKPANADAVYEVQNIKIENGESGERCAMILTGGGKQFQAFYNGSDRRLKPGAKLTNVKAQSHKNAFGAYAMIESYDVAA